MPFKKDSFTSDVDITRGVITYQYRPYMTVILPSFNNIACIWWHFIKLWFDYIFIYLNLYQLVFPLYQAY